MFFVSKGMGIGRGGERYRVVSLVGDLVEKSGTMSGGGKQVSRGRMSSNIQQDISPIQVLLYFNIKYT